MFYFSPSLQAEITIAVFSRILLTNAQWIRVLAETKDDPKTLLEFAIWDNKRPIA